SKQVLVTKAIGGYVGRVVQRYREWKKKQEEITNGTEKQVRELSKVERVIKRIHKAIGGFAKRVRRVSRTIRAWGRNFLWLGRDITIFTSMAIGAAVKSTAMWAKFAEQVKITQRVLTRRWATGRGEKFGPEDVAPGADIGGVTAEAALFGDPGTIMGLVAYAANQMAISISAATMSFGHLIRAGYGTVEALNVSNQAMILNRGSMISLADATDMMITIQKNFSKQIYDAAKIADIMTVADMNAVASMSELQSGMGFVSGTAARMGMSLEQTAAAMVLLTNAGFSGSVAGRELRSVLNNLMQNAEDYGIRIKDATGEMLPFETVLQSVEDRMNYFGTELERTQFLQEVFGETNISMVQALLRNKSELQALTNEFDDSGGAAEKAADTMKQTLEYRLDQLRVGFEKVQLAIGKGFSEALVGGDDFLGQLAKTLETVLPIVAELAFSFGVGFVESLSFFVSIAQEAIGYVMDFAEALGFISDSATTATGEVDETSGRVEFLGQSFGKVAGFALVVGPAMMAIGMALEILSPIMFGLGLIATLLAGGFGALTSAAGLAAGAIGGLGTVLAVIAGVVGAPVWVVVLAIVAALVLLSGIVIAITSEWDRFAAALDGLVRPILLALEFIFIALWHVIEPVVSIIFSLVEILLKLGMIIGGLIIIIVEILDFFKIWDILGIAIATGLGLIGIALELLAVPLQFFADLLEGISNALDWVVGLILGSSPGLIPALEALFAILGAPLDLAFGFLDTALENIGIAIDSLIGAFDSLVGAAQGAFDKLAEGDLIGAGQELVGGAIGAGQALGGGALDAAVNSIGDLADGVGGLVCGFFGCSPGLIPALEASTAAMQNFNEEAEKMKSKNITVAGSLKMTNKELSAMMGTNLDSWNQQVSGKGRDVVELGAETLRALARILLQEEKDWDWSVGKQRDQERDLTTPQIVSKRIYGGMSPR
ncbi:phage tail tape measure protein, partial [Candidatus Pacearchaeota archaeon]|nr:phage tail tape measure protein [Candidatus Pacearchaeota archaeon]